MSGIVCYDGRMIRPLIIGFATTFKHMFRKANTVNYPAEKVPVWVAAVTV